MKNVNAKKSVEIVESPRATTLMPNGFISYGYVCQGDVVLTEDQVTALKELPVADRHASLAE